MIDASKMVKTYDFDFSHGDGFYFAVFHVDGEEVKTNGLKRLGNKRHVRSMKMFNDIIDERMITPTQRFLRSCAARRCIANSRDRSEEFINQLLDQHGLDKEFYSADALTFFKDKGVRLFNDARDMGVWLKYEMLTRPGLLSVRSSGANRQAWSFKTAELPKPVPFFEITD